MQSSRDEEWSRDENATVEIVFFTLPGDREEQQDAFGYLVGERECLAVICDGMGGHKGGQEASRLAVREILDYYINYDIQNDPPGELSRCLRRCDEAIAALTDKNGEILHAGSTAVALYLRGYELNWVSVGDSRAYLFRAGEFVQFTKDQNYRTVLDEQLRAGHIDAEQHRSESGRGGTLISYLGIGNLSLIDYNQTPISLKEGDRLVMMSDGLYKLVSDEEIRKILLNFNNPEDALRVLNTKAARAVRGTSVQRDNMTVAILKIKPKE